MKPGLGRRGSRLSAWGWRRVRGCTARLCCLQVGSEDGDGWGLRCAQPLEQLTQPVGQGPRADRCNRVPGTGNRAGGKYSPRSRAGVLGAG